MSDSQLTKETLLPCRLCGSEPMGSLALAAVGRDQIVVRGTLYHCLGDDCEMHGDTRPTDDEAVESWNQKQREDSQS